MCALDIDAATRPQPQTPRAGPWALAEDRPSSEAWHEGSDGQGAGSDLEGIGLSARAGWYVGAVLFGVGGALVLLLYAFTSSLPQAVGVLAAISLLSSPLMLLGARMAPTARWGAPLRIAFGIGTIGSGAFLIGPRAAPVLGLLILFPILTSAYLHLPRSSIPFGIVGVSSVGVALMLDHLWASALTTTVTTSMLAVAAIFSQYQLRRVAAVSRKLSVTDALTGVGNVRRLRSRLLERLPHGRRAGERTAVFALDLDDFKQVNDRFSHTLGDEVLRTVADAINAQLATGDLLVRRGGDEFVVLCGPLGDRDPEQLRLRLSEAVSRARSEVCPEVNPNVSISCVLSELGDGVDALLTRADLALQAEKARAHPERRSQYVPPAQTDALRTPPTGIRPRPRRSTRDVLAVAAPQTQSELQVARWVQNSLGTGLAWGIAAAVNVVIGATLTTLAFTNVMPRLADTAGLALTACFYALAVLCVLASRRRSSVVALQASVMSTGAIMTVVFLHSGPDRWALLDLYMLPIMFAFYFLRPRQALPYLGLGLGAFTTLLAVSHFPLVLARTVVTTIVIGIMAGLLAKARRWTRSYTARAIEMSVVDPLTGVANLRGLRQRIADEIDRCSDASMRLALLVLDLDDFKSVNDRYGHIAGDAALTATAHAIGAQVRAGDLVARRGGDEFAVLCVRESEGSLHLMAGRVARAIEQARRELCPDLTPSAGISYVVWRAGESSDEFLARADGELHAVKESKGLTAVGSGDRAVGVA